MKLRAICTQAVFSKLSLTVEDQAKYEEAFADYQQRLYPGEGEATEQAFFLRLYTLASQGDTQYCADAGVSVYDLQGGCSEPKIELRTI